MQENSGSLNSDQKKTVTDQWTQIGELSKKVFLSNFSPKEIISELFSIDEAAMRVAKSFGVGREFADGIKMSLTEARYNVERMGGTFEDIVKIQLESNTALGRNVILQTKSYEELYATTKVTGQSAKDLISNFKDAGISAYDITKNMENVVNVARKSGVNAQIVSAKVVNNLESLNRYNFQGGVDGLAKMAAQATGLRIDMKSTLDFAEKVFDPEGAIETAAALQRLGVMQSDLLDPLRLMDLAQNDPAELQNQLAEMTKQFVRLNDAGQFEILPGEKRRLREISKELGLSYQELSRMAIGSADLERKLSRIQFPDTFTEEQKTMIANMAEMKDGEYRLTVGKEELGLDEALKRFSEDGKLLEEFMKAQEPVDMEELAEKQLDTLEQILASLQSATGKVGTAIATTESGDKLLKSVSGFFDKYTELGLEVLTGDKGPFSNKKLTSNMDGFINGIGDITTSLIGGEMSLDEAFEKLKTTSKLFRTEMLKTIEKLKKENPAVAGMIEDTVKLVLAKIEKEKILDGVNEVKEKVNDMIPNKSDDSKINSVKDFIKLPGQTIQPLPQDTLFGGTNFEGLLERMGNNSQNSPTESKITSDVNLNIKIDAPSQIDTNQLILAFNNQGLKEKIVESVKETMYNNGLTAPTSSKRKLMNPYIS